MGPKITSTFASFCTVICLGMGAVLYFASSVQAAQFKESPLVTTTPAVAPPPLPPSSAPLSLKIAAQQARVILEVLLVNDPDFPAISVGDAEKILSYAAGTVAEKFNFSGLKFNIMGEVSASDFMARYPNPKCIEQFAAQIVHPRGRSPKEIKSVIIEKFLSRWSVEELRQFFPKTISQDAPASGNIVPTLGRAMDSYMAIASALAEEFEAKLEKISQFKLTSGESLLVPRKQKERSYVHWLCAVREQNEADLILTNEFILYDLGSEPYPHSIFAKNKVGGASLHSPARKAIRGRAVIAATFSMVTDLPFFHELGVDTLSAEERLAVIGTFIVAHELGHALFKLPDFYDHPPQCLMTTKFETGYVSGYRELGQHPGGCPQCSPYIIAKSHTFLAHQAHQSGAFKTAIKELKYAIKTTPKHIDGSYLRYVAALSIDIAELYFEDGSRRQARRWLKGALRIVPDAPRGLALQVRLQKSKSSKIDTPSQAVP